MRLHAFIIDNMEDILQQWESCARDLWPSERPSASDLRDHAREMLHALLNDLQTIQSDDEQHDKSVGKGTPSAASDKVDSASERHAENRLQSGFDIRSLVAEYRALRASVMNLWSQAFPGELNVQDITRFNECVDQLLAKSIQRYTDSMEHSRELLLGILGHDLKSPLCAVSMMAGLLEENEKMDDRYRHMASLIVVSAREMKQLVDDLLEFAGSHLGVKLHVERQPMNLEELCQEVIEEIRAAYPSLMFELESSGDGNGDWDRARIRQVMTNLLANSVKHGDEESPIRLSMQANGNTVVLGVCNQGSPIPPAMQAVMFDPLRRCNAQPQEVGGIGLGLYIAKELVNAHGGDIEVKSDRRETVFMVKLPRHDPALIKGF